MRVCMMAPPPQGRRSRSNSFRGKVMHEEIRGECEVVGSTSEGTGDAKAENWGEGGEAKGVRAVGPRRNQPEILQRRLSCRPQLGRYKSTLTIRQTIEKKLEEIKQREDLAQLGFVPSKTTGGLVSRRPSNGELEEFKLLVHKLDCVDPKAFDKFRSTAHPEDIQMLERMAMRLFVYFEGKEKDHARLTTADFELKSTVDDVIVRLFGSEAPAETEQLPPGAPNTPAPPTQISQISQISHISQGSGGEGVGGWSPTSQPQSLQPDTPVPVLSVAQSSCVASSDATPTKTLSQTRRDAKGEDYGGEEPPHENTHPLPGPPEVDYHKMKLFGHRSPIEAPNSPPVRVARYAGTDDGGSGGVGEVGDVGGRGLTAREKRECTVRRKLELKVDPESED
eukprot:comp21220_c0_seq1/m.28862 comp21220_c0_seq1/g.28862  ORF comp21220_c0_seq1/g.28862 comp21220_c0_seq1/m.28862 type:complete len:394 (-) comp21220_c0_seq1:29-1210(-)